MTDKTWKLMSVTRGGVVSLVPNLTKADAEFMRCRLLRIPATPEETLKEREQYEFLHPPGPNYEGDGRNVTKEQWAEWHKEHPMAQGCRWKTGSCGWGGWRICQDSDVERVEIFE